MNLPELPPKGDMILFTGHRESFTYHGEEDMKAYGIACARAALEEAAKVAGETVCDTHLPTGIRIYGQVAAKAIRAIEVTP